MTTLSALNTYTGTTTINSDAMLSLSGAGSIGNSSRVIANGTFDIGQTSDGTAINSLGGNGSVVLGGNILTITNANDSFAGVISGAGGLQVNGGTQTLAGANTYRGGTLVNGATLQMSGAGTLGAAAGYTAVQNGGVLDLGGTSQTQNGGLIVNGGTVQNGTLDSSYAFLLYAGTVSSTLSGTGLVLAMSGTSVLSGVNTYTGGTAVSGGTLQIAGSGTLGAASGMTTINSGGVLDLGGTNQTQNGNLVLDGGTLQNGTLTSSGAFVLTGGTISAVLAGTGNLAQNSGTTTLSGANTYTGGTWVNGGALVLSGGTLGASTNATTINLGSVLDLGGTRQTQDGGLTLAGGTLQDGTLTSNRFFSLGGGAVFAVLDGAGYVYQHAGATTLLGVNSYTGITEIVGGTLALAGNGSITASALFDNGNFDISRSGHNPVQVGGLTGFGTVMLGGNTLAVGNGGYFSGVISGSGGLALMGGTQILTGTNTYQGLTMIVPGATLRIGNGGTTGAVAGDIADLGSLVFDRSDVVTISGTIGGSGTLTQLGTGTLVLLGQNTVSGRVTVAAGNLVVGNAATPGAVLNATSGGVSVGSAGTLWGHGTILGAVNNTAGGTVHPGGSIGALGVGSYVQSANSTLAIEVSPSRASSLNVTGAASLAGTVAVTFDQGTYGSRVFPILTAASVTGTFGSMTVAGTTQPGLVYGLSYAPAGNEVDLVLASTLTSAVYGNAMSQALDSADGYAQTVLNHGTECSGIADARGGAVCGANCVWMKALGSTGQTTGNGVTSGYNGNRAGMVGGIDRAIATGLNVGVSFGWTRSTANTLAYAAGAKLDQYDFGLYTGVQFGGVRIDADGFYGSSTNHVTRDTQGGGMAMAQFNGRGYGAALRLSAPLANSAVIPFGEVRWTRQTHDAALENGAGALDFTIAGQSRNDGHAVAGVRFQRNYVADTGPLVPHLEIALDQQIGQTNRTVSGGLVGMAGANFAGAAITPARTAAITKAGFVVQLGHAVEVFGDLGDKFSANRNEVNGTGGVRMHF